MRWFRPASEGHAGFVRLPGFVSRRRTFLAGTLVLKVIIIEDDSAVRESLLLLLRQLDFQPVAYASAEAFIDAEPPDCGDVLLVDIELPGMSGAELIELVRKQPRPRAWC